MKYLLTNEVIAAELWKMLVSNPAYSEDLTTKAKPAKSAVCTYFKFRPGVQETVAGDFPDISLAKSGWRTDGPLNGIFVAGTWTFRVRLESDTKYGFSVKVAIRLSRSSNSDGSGATLIVVSESPNVIAIPAAAGGSVTDTWTWSASALTLSNEYLFAEYRIHIEVAGTSTTCQCSFACDEDPATADESIQTPGLSYTYKLYENLSAIRDVFSSVLTELVEAFSYKFYQILVLRENSVRLASVRSLIRKLPQDLSSIRDVFSSVYTPLGLPVYKFVENLSVLGAVPRRIVSYSRRQANDAVTRDALSRTVGLPRKFVENLSPLSETLTRRVAMVRRMTETTFVRDVFSFVLTPLIPVYRFAESIVVSVALRRRVGMTRSAKEDLSAIRHILSYLLTVSPMVYRLVQDLSSISHIFSHIYSPFVGPIVDKLLEAKAKLESERDAILAKIGELQAKLEKLKAEFKL